MIRHPYTHQKIKTGEYPIYDPKYSLYLCPRCGLILNTMRDDYGNLKPHDAYGHPYYNGEDCWCGWNNEEHREYNI
jgi:hypothetical protein